MVLGQPLLSAVDVSTVSPKPEFILVCQLREDLTGRDPLERALREQKKQWWVTFAFQEHIE